MVERLRNREEVILTAIVLIAITTIAGAVAAAFGSSSDALQIATGVLGFGGTVLGFLYNSLKVDKAEGNLTQTINSQPTTIPLTTRIDNVAPPVGVTVTEPASFLPQGPETGSGGV